MYHNLQDFHIYAAPSADTQHAINRLQALFEHRHEAFMNAAALLAGARGVGIVSSITEHLQKGILGRGTKSALRRLLAILTLDDVDAASDYFLRIEPEDPAVEEICLLTDELRETMEAAFMQQQ